jgi:hypothetical protein
MKKIQFISGLMLLTLVLFANNTFGQKLESEFLYKITLVLDQPIETGKTPF